MILLLEPGGLQSITIRPKTGSKSQNPLGGGDWDFLWRLRGRLHISVSAEGKKKGATEHERIFLDSKAVLGGTSCLQEPGQAALGTPWSSPPASQPEQLAASRSVPLPE